MSIFMMLVAAMAIVAALTSVAIEATIVLRDLGNGQPPSESSPSGDPHCFDAYLADLMWWK